MTTPLYKSVSLGSPSISANGLTVLILLLFSGLSGFGQKHFARSGEVQFFSSTPIEDIEAKSQALTALFDASTGEIAFQVPIRSFHFPNALMEEHFNENYLESEQHPKATFAGTIAGWEESKPAAEGADVVAVGDFTCHGVTVPREIAGKLTLNDEGRWTIQATFNVATADHEIPIPAVVQENIAAEIEVTVHVTLEPR